MNEPINLQIIVSGRVQGVGFRYSVMQLAKHDNVSGWVKNLNDGTVKILVSGLPSEVKRFTNQVKKNPNPIAFISNVSVTQLDHPLKFSDFSIH